MVEVLGWVNIGLIILMGTIYPIKKIYIRSKSQRLLNVYRKVRLLHPILGLIVVTIGLIHGYLALGTLRLHTGSLLLTAIIVMGCVTSFGRRQIIFKKNWIMIHRNLVPILFVLIIIHVFFRSLI